MAQVNLKNITKYFGSFKAIDNLTLEINDGEFFTLLGPSGCGKTTTMRVVAGFIDPQEGDVYFEDKRMNSVPAHKRNTGMVFQDYALFPNMSIYDNVAYGLKARKESKKDIDRKVNAMLEKVELGGLTRRYPNALSGGQQQRVALARALVIEPEVLLMDEPLSNLDAKLRINMREVIKRLQKEVGITTIFVTHDQEEAVSVSDRVAVMRQGCIEQIGSPMDVYRNPANRFVAGFIGSANLIEARVVSSNNGKDMAVLDIDGEEIQVSNTKKLSSNVLCCLRPEEIYIVDGNDEGVNTLKGRVVSVMFMGSMVKYRIQAFEGIELKVEKQNIDDSGIKSVGQEVTLNISANCRLLDI